MKKDFLSITDITPKELLEILFFAKQLKEKEIQSGQNTPLFANKTLLMIFEKPSLRTRISFEVAAKSLGGNAVYLGPQEIGLGIRESIKDVAKVAGSMGNVLMARTFLHSSVQELAAYADVPVINGLSDLEHPCQILADLLTILEVKGTLKGLKLAFIGDGENNVPHSLALGAAMTGLDFSIAAPKDFWMKPEIFKKATEIAKQSGAKILQTESPEEAAKNADVMYTDTWVSMGDESEKEFRVKIFIPYQVTSTLMNLAKTDAIFMHDMPAYRGMEVVADVIDGKQSVVYKQAENRLHAQKALLAFFIKN